MPFAESPQREFAAATEWAAGRTLDALTGAEGAALPAPAAPEPQALLAGVRVLGPDVFVPALLTGAPTPPETVEIVAEAYRVFPSDESGIHAWRDRATAELLALAGYPAPVPSAPPPPDPGKDGWQRWSVQMAQLSCLALPHLDGPVHRVARDHPLALARGAARATLRRDHRTSVRLVRWLAWLHHTGSPAELELPPLLRQLALTGDGSARSALDLAVAEHLAAE
ncbi:hypothetical protein ACIQF6_23555 [Kitasatospora sp. NPDC092948]|uniref:hypothetical protein n=1 Tax=Kitasatospora sp. NPDC092948 TaxID=3364088 RepID=UPI003821F02D